MSWPAIEAALDGILERRWYTNHGPLARQLEAVVADTLGLSHAVAVTNPTIALIMLAEALDLSGDVSLSALAPIRCAQALRWAGLHPVFHDLSSVPTGPMLRSRSGDRVDSSALPDGAALSDGLVLPGIPAVLRLPAWGDRAQAACIVTDNAGLAARLRNIRSSYGAGSPVPVRRTANGRLSEAQAAMCLLAWPPAVAPACATVAAGLPVHELIDIDGRAGLIFDTSAERDETLVRLAGAEPLLPCSPPGLCPRADSLARRIVLLPEQLNKDAPRSLA